MEHEMEWRTCPNDGRKFRVMKGSTQELCSNQCEFVNGRPTRAALRAKEKTSDPKRIARIEAIKTLMKELGWTQRKVAFGSSFAPWKVSHILHGVASVTDAEIEKLHQHLIRQKEGMEV